MPFRDENFFRGRDQDFGNETELAVALRAPCESTEQTALLLCSVEARRAVAAPEVQGSRESQDHGGGRRRVTFPLPPYIFLMDPRANEFAVSIQYQSHLTTEFKIT